MNADRPGQDGVDGPVASSPLDETRGREALAKASTAVGLDPHGAELIRLGDYAMFRLPSGPVVAWIGRHPSRLVDAEREVRVARWLAAVGVPAIRALDVDQPVVADGRVVSFWEPVSDRPEYGTPGGAGCPAAPSPCVDRAR